MINLAGSSYSQWLCIYVGTVEGGSRSRSCDVSGLFSPQGCIFHACVHGSGRSYGRWERLVEFCSSLWPLEELGG